MKRIIVVLFAAILLFGYASADSLTQSIAWLSNDTKVLQDLTKAGFVRENADSVDMSHDNVVYLIKNEQLNYQPFVIPAYKSYALSLSLGTKAKGKIAGYPVDNMSLVFAYDGEYKLIAIKADLINADYTMLKDKIDAVYGEGEVKELEEEGIESVLWRGQDNAGILLYTESYGEEYTLIFGRLDAEDVLLQCSTDDPKDTSGL